MARYAHDSTKYPGYVQKFAENLIVDQSDRPPLIQFKLDCIRGGSVYFRGFVEAYVGAKDCTRMGRKPMISSGRIVFSQKRDEPIAEE